MGKKKIITITEMKSFAIDTAMTENERAASLLDYAAKACPKRWLKVPDVLKIIHGRKRAPYEGSDEVILFKKNKWSTIKRILEKTYARYGYSVGGLGIRATTSDEDVAGTVHNAAVRRAHSTARRAQEINESIDTKNIKDKDLKSEVSNARRGLRMLNTQGVMKLLNAPKKPPPNGNGD